MLVVLRPEAEEELLEAQAWYESKALGLGFEFARAADAAVASALRNPFGHLRIEEEFRISTVNRAFGLSGLVAEGIISCYRFQRFFERNFSI
jgi:hypothetical protein